MAAAGADGAGSRQPRSALGAAAAGAEAPPKCRLLHDDRLRHVVRRRRLLRQVRLDVALRFGIARFGLLLGLTQAREETIDQLLFLGLHGMTSGNTKRHPRKVRLPGRISRHAGNTTTTVPPGFRRPPRFATRMAWAKVGAPSNHPSNAS